ncbi:toxin-antitoxin system YwqK family antitoxin [Tenacibaculum agarivorans]|uniref:toxin-antitoxin system YwqK family antitoxin n=1 Tax=Tenacibaculum agarivorans TaxID=1908389 RepID=UPI00094B9581|nr:hypothetical protein [Tenacibaculum agarivorans]
MNKVKVLFLFFVLQVVLVLSQNNTKQKFISHKIYGKAIEEKTLDKEGTLLFKKIFTLNKKLTKEKYEIGTYFYYHKNGTLKAKGDYYKVNEANVFGQRKEYKEGEWFFYTDRGTISSIISLKDNKEHGDFKSYHPNGKIASQGSYTNGRLDGVVSSFFMNNQLHRKIAYKSGKVFNVVEFFNSEGEKINHGTLKNGYGTFKAYDLKTGELEKIFTYENGIPENVSIEEQTTAKGKLKVLTYKNNDGSIKKVKRLVNDVLEGKQEFYNFQGKLDSTVSYKNGKKHGLFITYMSDGETKANEINFVNGKKKGKYIKRRYTEDEGNPVLIQYGSYNDEGELSGTYNAYLGEEKQLVETGKYRAGKQVGVWKNYNRKGQLYKEIHFKKSNQQETKEYYPEKSALKSSTNYKDGHINGEFKVFFNNSQLKKIGKYKDLKKEGQWMVYNEAGKLLEDKLYKNGELLEKKEYIYFTNGKIKKEYFKTYKDSTSTTRQYTITGNLYKIESHKDFKTGVRSVYVKKHGVFKLYNENGTQILKEGSYKGGEKEGVWKTYEKGRLKSVITYVDGEKMGAFENYDYYENGQKESVVKGIRFEDNRKNTTTYYYENGKVKEVGNYLFFYNDRQNSGKNGEWKSFYDNGKKKSQESYVKGKREGKFVHYYNDGKIKSKETYAKGKKSGECIYYYDNGKVESQGNYIKANKETLPLVRSLYYKVKIGLWQHFYRNGDIKEEANYTISQDHKFVIKKVKEFYEEGKIKSEKLFHGSKQEGVHRTFYKNGNIDSEKMYHEGYETGVHKEFFENGNLALITLYNEDGYRSNVKEYYNLPELKKQLKIEMQFDEDGYILNIPQYFDIKGGKLDVGTLKDGTGTLKYYDKNNKVIKVEKFIEGELDE